MHAHNDILSIQKEVEGRLRSICNFPQIIYGHDKIAEYFGDCDDCIYYFNCYKKQVISNITGVFE